MGPLFRVQGSLWAVCLLQGSLCGFSLFVVWVMFVAGLFVLAIVPPKQKKYIDVTPPVNGNLQ
jgi:hypothetical protein